MRMISCHMTATPNLSAGRTTARSLKWQSNGCFVMTGDCSRLTCSCRSKGFELWGSCAASLDSLAEIIYVWAYTLRSGAPPQPLWYLKSLRYQAKPQKVVNKTPASSKELAFAAVVEDHCQNQLKSTQEHPRRHCEKLRAVLRLLLESTSSHQELGTILRTQKRRQLGQFDYDLVDAQNVRVTRDCGESLPGLSLVTPMQEPRCVCVCV